MAIGSNNDFPSVLFTEGTTPTTPAASHQRLFVRSSDHVLCTVNSSGTVVAVGTGTGLTNPLTTTGDMIYSSSGTTAARLGIGATGAVATVAGGLPSWALPPGYQLDYAEQTTPLNPITATTEATANTFLTGGGFAADGTSSYMIEAFIPLVYAAAGHAANAYLFDGSSSIGQLGQIYSSGTATIGGVMHLARKLTPSAATKTYSIRFQSDSATGSSAFCGAGGVGNIMPAFIRVTKV